MASDTMLLKTLEELLRSWMETMTPNEIGSDPEKIRLLKEVSGEVVGEPTPFIREVYQEVFLRDVWTRGNPGGRNQG